MADAPWRCSECGTINEPVANACRTCGRWPSLFDLQESTLDDAEPQSSLEPDPTFEPEPAFEPGPAFEPEVTIEEFEGEPFEETTVDRAEQESPSDRGRRIIGSIIVPLAVVIYLVITFIVNR